MKKLIIIFFIIFLPYTSSAATFQLWTPSMETTWTNLMNTNHLYWRDLLQFRDSSDAENRGIRWGVHYILTGDSNSAVQAWEEVDHYCGRTYTPTNCKIPVGNEIRHAFVRLSILYSWIGDGLSATNKSRYRDILNLWTDIVLGENPTSSSNYVSRDLRFNDTDNLIGWTFGNLLHALVIREDDETRSDYILNFSGNYDVGGLDVDLNDGSISARDKIYNFFTTIGVGGEWAEGSYYDMQTLRYAINAVNLINYYCAQNRGNSICGNTSKFDEITGQYSNMASALTNMFTPDLSTYYLWGDTQDSPLSGRRQGLTMTLGNVSASSSVRYLADQFWGSSVARDDSWIIYATDDTGSIPSGITSHNSSGMGISYYHEGWGINDSFFMSQLQTRTRTDHDHNGFADFQLWRNDGWAITHPRTYIYNDWVESYYNNATLVNGFFPSRYSESLKQTAYYSADNVLYHSGTAGGFQESEDYYNPPLQHIEEYTRTHFYMHNADDSDSIIIFDRLNACNPVTCIGNFTRYRADVENKVVASTKADGSGGGGHHRFLMHSPVQPSKSSDRFTWTAENGETVYWDTLIDNYSVEYSNSFNIGGGSIRGMLWQTRLIPDSTATVQNLINVLHVGSNPTVTKIIASSGEVAIATKIVSGTEEKVVIMNGTEETNLPSASTISGSYVTWNDNKHDDLKNLRYFQQSFSITIPVTTSAEVFIVDLDPTLTWTYTIDGGASNAMTVDSSSFSTFTITDTGNPVLLVQATGAAEPTCAQSWTNCSTSDGGTECTANNWYWYNSVCNQNPEAASCDIDNLNLCTTSVECHGAGGWNVNVENHWYDSNNDSIIDCNLTAEASEPGAASTFGYESDADCVWGSDFSETSGQLGDDCASLTATTSSVTTKSANSWDFDGVNDYVEIPDDATIDFADEDLTVCWKGNFDSFSTGYDQVIILKGQWDSGGVRYGMYLTNISTGSAFDVDDNSAGDGKSSADATPHNFSVDTTYKLCGVRDTVNNEIRHYRGTGDLSLVKTVTDTTNSIAGQNSRPLVLGGGCDASEPCPRENWFDGQMNEAFIFKRALTLEEINTWATNGLIEPSTVDVRPAIERKILKSGTFFGATIQ